MQVKICGVRRPADVAACLAAGADLLGLNLVPGSRRCLDLPTATALARQIPGSRGVAVLRSPSAAQLVRILSTTGLQVVQLHGPLEPGLLDGLPCKVIRAVPGGAPVVPEPVDLYLLDGPNPGSGTTWNWTPVDLPRLAFIAGGLTPGNVARAIHAARPHGVDVASGVEVDGQLNAEQIQQFVTRAKETLR